MSECASMYKGLSTTDIDNLIAERKLIDLMAEEKEMQIGVYFDRLGDK
jgi:hypothetical protein